MTISFVEIRSALAQLPRADNTTPDSEIDPKDVIVPVGHRGALDPERTLVVGNRGMGKSFWTHALRNPAIRSKLAQENQQLRNMEVEVGFNGSETGSEVTPAALVIKQEAERRVKVVSIWRAVIVRFLRKYEGVSEPMPLREAIEWVDENAEGYVNLLRRIDGEFAQKGAKLLLVFDALDRLGDDWETTQELTKGLLQLALSMRSTRSIRCKLFIRPDQFDDGSLFQFPDASKIKNDRVDLRWRNEELYKLLFARLADQSSEFDRLEKSKHPDLKSIIDTIAGEFMGSNKRRGRVYTWVPKHLADARDETSPRTFLTVWREAACHEPSPSDRAIDHHGINEGVRKASEDRLSELREDYPWIGDTLRPLKDTNVPMPAEALREIWATNKTVSRLKKKDRFLKSAPVQLFVPAATTQPEDQLIQALRSIGVLELRSNDKINVPDIFRVEAGIGRRGGVKPPKRSGRFG